MLFKLFPFFSLELLDFLFHFLHIFIIFWNLFGWMFQRFIILHFLSLNLVLFSWGFLGFFYGFGYCFLTDFHWRIKIQKGETNLPNSYIEYILQKFGFYFDSNYVDIFVLMITIIIYIISFYFFYKKIQLRKFKK